MITEPCGEIFVSILGTKKPDKILSASMKALSRWCTYIPTCRSPWFPGGGQHPSSPGVISRYFFFFKWHHLFDNTSNRFFNWLGFEPCFSEHGLPDIGRLATYSRLECLRRKLHVICNGCRGIKTASRKVLQSHSDTHEERPALQVGVRCII